MVTRFLVCGLHPISTVRQKGFRELCHAFDPRYVLPATQTLSKKLIPKLDEKVMDGVRDDLSKVRSVALTTDGWSAKVC